MLTYRKGDAPPGVALAVATLAPVFEKLAGDFWIAGGAVLEGVMWGTQTSDVDLFFRSDEERQRVLGQLTEQGGSVGLTAERVIKTTHPELGQVDLIRSTYADPIGCISTFDFTVACAAIDRNGVFYCHKEFFRHLAERTLVINDCSFPLSTMERIAKYARKGFTVAPAAIYAIAQRTKQSDLKEMETFYQ